MISIFDRLRRRPAHNGFRDRIFGGPGADRLFGGFEVFRTTEMSYFSQAGGDYIDGDNGADTIYGDMREMSLPADFTGVYLPDNTIHGGAGADTVYGNAQTFTAGEVTPARGTPAAPTPTAPASTWCPRFSQASRRARTREAVPPVASLRQAVLSLAASVA